METLMEEGMKVFEGRGVQWPTEGDQLRGGTGDGQECREQKNTKNLKQTEAVEEEGRR